LNFIFKPTVEFRLMKKAVKEAEADWANHVADGYEVRYPFYASDKPWPVHRWTVIESKDEYGEKGGNMYQAKWKQLFLEECARLIRERDSHSEVTA